MSLTANAPLAAQVPQGIGFGGASVGNLRRAISDDQAERAIRRAWDRGVRYFDTAPHYGLGLSERRLGATLRTFPRHEFCLSTKVGRMLVPRVPPLEQDDDGFVVPGDLKRRWDFTVGGVRDSIEQSLDRMGLAGINIAFAHDPDQAYEGAQLEGLQALAAAKDAGLVAAVGIGTNSTQGLVDAVDRGLIDVLMLANRYTLLDYQEALPVLAAADRTGTVVVAAGVFNSGLLATPRPAPGAHFDYQEAHPEVVEAVHAIADICEAHGVDVPTAAIAFPLLQPSVRSVVLGMRSEHDVDENMDRFEREVPSELWRDLASAGLIEAEAVSPTGSST